LRLKTRYGVSNKGVRSFKTRTEHERGKRKEQN